MFFIVVVLLLMMISDGGGGGPSSLDASGSLDQLSLSSNPAGSTSSKTDFVSGSNTSLQQSDPVHDMESPESSLNRQEIAMGVSPIAAR